MIKLSRFLSRLLSRLSRLSRLEPATLTAPRFLTVIKLSRFLSRLSRLLSRLSRSEPTTLTASRFFYRDKMTKIFITFITFITLVKIQSLEPLPILDFSTVIKSSRFLSCLSRFLSRLSRSSKFRAWNPYNSIDMIVVSFYRGSVKMAERVIFPF